MNVTQAVIERRSIRAFRPDPVPPQLLREILGIAQRAPSGGNLQPWQVYALGGGELARFKALIASKLDAGISGEEPEYAIYPADLWEPFRRRRRAAGAQRYAALGVSDKDRCAQLDLLRRNFAFFGAPVGLFFCIDRRLGAPQWSDLGMYMQTLMLLAVERGLDSCPQEVWANWPRTIARFLELPDEQMVFAGMSLGYRDERHPLNAIRSAREPFDTAVVLRGF